MTLQHSARWRSQATSTLAVAFWMALLAAVAGCQVAPDLQIPASANTGSDSSVGQPSPGQSSELPDGDNVSNEDEATAGDGTDEGPAEVKPSQPTEKAPETGEGELQMGGNPVEPPSNPIEQPESQPEGNPGEPGGEQPIEQPEQRIENPIVEPPSSQSPETQPIQLPSIPNEPPSNPIEPPANPVEPPSNPVEPPVGGNGQQNGSTPVEPPPAPVLPDMPAARRAFLGYIPDGGYMVADGVGAAPLRNIAINAMPRLARYGFGRYVSPGYLGIARSEADARSYFAPLTAAARANGMDYVPGFFLHHIVDALYGVPWSEPWNVTGPESDLRHPMNPGAVVEPRFWDEVVTRAVILARGAESRQVYIDAEFVFWMHRDSSVWTDANLALIKPLVRDAVRRLREQNVFLTMYHPHVHPNVPEIMRIALGIFGPESADDPLSYVEHFAPAPFYNTTRYRVPGVVSIANEYTSRGYQDSQVCFGFISNHVFEGFSPAAYDTYCQVNPGIAERTWYFTTSAANDRIAREFEAIVTAPPPTN